MLHRDDLVFPMDEYQRRLRDLRRRMDERDLDLVMTTTPENICYLSGFESPGHYYFNALIVPREGEPVAVPRRLEDSGYQALTWLEQTRPYQDHEEPMDKTADTLEEFCWQDKRIGYEKSCWFFTAAQQEKLFGHCPQATFVDCSGIVEAGRLIKSDHEVALMRQAARATEAGMRAGIDAVAAGASENDVAAEMHYAMIKAGSEWPSIVPFVASGYRGAIGHATWAGRTIEEGDIIMLELAGCLKRYHAPLMRTGFVGEPSARVREAEQVVQEAFEAMVATIRPGVTAHEADAASREVIGKAQLGGEQGSRSAYSVGIGLPPDWGEGQILSMQPGEMRPLQANMTFHVLPWVQAPGEGGISFSETIRITEDGCELLTDFERALFVR
ncbi:MAG TPA: Xaa-Pro peptidase family protein [Candidatus Sulfomarinibacteraceae bacterium]|nr:Xaa-Pro peptidase family protein [Candidatus Sulfomarinibacteraceae bacterium]